MVEGTDGQPPGPQPHVHILPCPYDTRAVRADSLYSRGERGEDAEGGPLWSPVRCLVAARILYNPGKEEKCKLDSLGELI